MQCPLPQCGKVYSCRLCHDDNEISHGIDRFGVNEVVCRKCSTRQPVTNICCECGLVFGKYYCSICRLYDNNEKGQFHCDKCGLCRIGGRENFFHCDNCGYCLGKEMLSTHHCRKDNSKNNCPVCMEDIHTSRDPAHVPLCGHLIHMLCYRDLLARGLYRCPQCQTSFADMKNYWAKTDDEIKRWEMPQHLKDFKVKVSCMDCREVSETVFHVVGLKCMNETCGSYNTVRCGNEDIPQDAVPVNAEEFMEYLQQEREQHGEEEHDDNQEGRDEP